MTPLSIIKCRLSQKSSCCDVMNEHTPNEASFARLSNYRNRQLRKLIVVCGNWERRLWNVSSTFRSAIITKRSLKPVVRKPSSPQSTDHYHTLICSLHSLNLLMVMGQKGEDGMGNKNNPRHHRSKFELQLELERY